MEKKLISIKGMLLPSYIIELAAGADCYDSSSSPEARVIYIDKGEGFFVKIAPHGELKREVELTTFMHDRGYAPEVVKYITSADYVRKSEVGDDISSNVHGKLTNTKENCIKDSGMHRLNNKNGTALTHDYMVTKKLIGHDGIDPSMLLNPKKLVEIFASSIAIIHDMDYSKCPVTDHLVRYNKVATENYKIGKYCIDYGQDYCINNAEEARKIVEQEGKHLQADSLIHGDYCLPNIIIAANKLSGFVDLGNGGVSDRHIDIYWALSTLNYNLHTHKYDDLFCDIYGRNRINKEKLRIVAAHEIFG